MSRSIKSLDLVKRTPNQTTLDNMDIEQLLIISDLNDAFIELPNNKNKHGFEEKMNSIITEINKRQSVKLFKMQNDNEELQANINDIGACKDEFQYLELSDFVDLACKSRTNSGIIQDEDGILNANIEQLQNDTKAFFVELREKIPRQLNMFDTLKKENMKYKESDNQLKEIKIAFDLVNADNNKLKKQFETENQIIKKSESEMELLRKEIDMYKQQLVENTLVSANETFVKMQETVACICMDERALTATYLSSCTDTHVRIGVLWEEMCCATERIKNRNDEDLRQTDKLLHEENDSLLKQIEMKNNIIEEMVAELQTFEQQQKEREQLLLLFKKEMKSIDESNKIENGFVFNLQSLWRDYFAKVERDKQVDQLKLEQKDNFINILQQKLQNATTKITNNEKEMQLLSDVNKEDLYQIEELRNELDMMERVDNANRDRIEQLEADLTAVGTALVLLNTENTSLKTQIETNNKFGKEMENSKRERENMVQKLLKNENKLTMQVKNLEEMVNERNGKLNETEKMLHVLNEECDTYHKQINDQKLQIQEKYKTIDKLTRQMSMQKKRNSKANIIRNSDVRMKLQSKIDDLANEYTKKEREYKIKLYELEVERKNKQHVLQTLGVMNDEQRCRIGELNDELEEMSEKHKMSVNSIMEKESEINEMKTTVNNYKLKVDELERNITEIIHLKSDITVEEIVDQLENKLSEMKLKNVRHDLYSLWQKFYNKYEQNRMQEQMEINEQLDVMNNKSKELKKMFTTMDDNNCTLTGSESTNSTQTLQLDKNNVLCFWGQLSGQRKKREDGDLFDLKMKLKDLSVFSGLLSIDQ